MEWRHLLRTLIDGKDHGGVCNCQTFPDGRVILLLVNIEESCDSTVLKNVIEVSLDIEGFESPLQNCGQLLLHLQCRHFDL